MIEIYSRYNNFISPVCKFITWSTPVVACAAQWIPFEQSSIILAILTILTVAITSLRDILKYGQIIRRCTEQIVRYKKLLEMTKTIQTEEELIVANRSYQQIMNYDPDIPIEITEEFKHFCESINMPVSFDYLQQYKELHLVEMKIKENASEVDKISLSELQQKIMSDDGDFSPRTQQKKAQEEIKEFRNSVDLKNNTANLKKLNNINVKYGTV